MRPIIIIIIMLSILILVRHYKQNQAEYHQYGAYNSANAAASTLIEPTRKQITAKGKQQYSKEAIEEAVDRSLQRADNLSQIDMATYALLGLIVGVLGIGMIAGTLKYTRDAAEAAKKTLKVARESLDEAKSATRKELRAYLGVEHIKANAITVQEGILPRRPIERPAPNPIHITLTFKNVGQTPANKVSLEHSYIIGGDDIPDELPEKNMEKSNLGSIMPNGVQHVKINVSIESPDEWTMCQLLMMEGKVYIHFYGTFTYVDIYGSQHTTKFNAFHSGNRLDGVGLKVGAGEDNYMT